jgi:hypothetical protein
MKQYKIKSEHIDQSSDNDAYLSPSDPIHELKIVQYLAGLNSQNRLYEYRAKQEEARADQGSNISITGTEKAQIQREKNIKPGTPEWFRLWFSLPYLTGKNQ